MGKNSNHTHYSHRSKVLDQHIGKIVSITFHNDKVARGFLGFNEKNGEGLSGKYKECREYKEYKEYKDSGQIGNKEQLEHPAGVYTLRYHPSEPGISKIFFRKSRVKSIEVLEDPSSSDREPDSLKDALSYVPADIIVAIGSGSSFLFIGTIDEFWKDIDIIDNFCREKNAQSVSVADRKVEEIYMKHAPDEPAMIAFIVEGNEEGGIWTRDEYEKWIRRQDRAE